MPEPLTPRDREPHAARSADRFHPEVDWPAIEREPDFQELVRRRRAFVLPGTAFFLLWYMAFIVVTAVAPDFMGEPVYQGLTVGYVYALTQFAMVLALGIWYLRKADRDFDPLARRIHERHEGYVDRAGTPMAADSNDDRSGRHRRVDESATTAPPTTAERRP